MADTPSPDTVEETDAPGAEEQDEQQQQGGGPPAAEAARDPRALRNEASQKLEAKEQAAQQKLQAAQEELPDPQAKTLREQAQERLKAARRAEEALRAIEYETEEREIRSRHELRRLKLEAELARLKLDEELDRLDATQDIALRGRGYGDDGWDVGDGFRDDKRRRSGGGTRSSGRRDRDRDGGRGRRRRSERRSSWRRVPERAFDDLNDTRDGIVNAWVETVLAGSEVWSDVHDSIVDGREGRENYDLMDALDDIVRVPRRGLDRFTDTYRD